MNRSLNISSLAPLAPQEYNPPTEALEKFDRDGREVRLIQAIVERDISSTLDGVISYRQPYNSEKIGTVTIDDLRTYAIHSDSDVAKYLRRRWDIGR